MKSKKKKLHPARRAVLRGLGVVLPPLLTIVVFLWAWSLIESKILVHMESGAAWCLTFGLGDSYPEPPPEARVTEVDGETVHEPIYIERYHYGDFGFEQTSGSYPLASLKRHGAPPS